MLITSEKASRYYVKKEEIKNGKFVYVDAKKKPKKFKVLMKVRPGLLWFLLRRFFTLVAVASRCSKEKSLN
jgi:hypothetical protein